MSLLQLIYQKLVVSDVGDELILEGAGIGSGRARLTHRKQLPNVLGAELVVRLAVERVVLLQQIRLHALLEHVSVGARRLVELSLGEVQIAARRKTERSIVRRVVVVLLLKVKQIISKKGMKSIE
jgi:hypothetical protein